MYSPTSVVLIYYKQTMTTRDATELNDDITTDVTTDPAELKRLAKLEQLASARQSMKDKKRKRDDDISSIATKLDEISNRLDKQQTKPPEQEEPPVEKRQRVTKEEPVTEVEESEPISDSWTTSIIRTGTVLTLGAASYYMQNMYGKAPTTTTRKAPEKKKTPTSVPKKIQLQYDHLQTARNRKMIGTSGFVS